MASLCITLLGGFEARLASGEAVAFGGRKSQALLAYLALISGGRCPRDKLIRLLWSDRGQSHARGSLRKALVELRKALSEADPPPLRADRDEVSLDASAVEVDAVEFERLVADGAPEALECATELYQGDLLDGIGVHDPAFEDWLRSERERLHDRAREAFSRLLDHQTGTGATDAAIATARRLLALDPLQESTHRALMRLYADQDDRAMAVKQYQACREVLRAELGLRLDAETERVIDEIREGVSKTDEAETPASSPAGATEPLALPDKPSIAVLPFTNMSGDPEQEYFSDGITENVITGLCRYPELLVIARNSTFVYKGRAVAPKIVGRELGVRYLLEGGIRKVGNRVRITAQLIDARSGHHVWADRYDRELADIFELQDEITRVIVGAVGATLHEAVIDDAERKDPAHLSAYDLTLRSEAQFFRHGKDGLASAREYAERAIAIDSRYARPRVLMAWTHLYERWSGYTNDPDRSLRIGFEAASKAVLIDTKDAPAHVVLGITHLLMHNHDQAVVELEQSIELSPSYADSHAQLANALGMMGRTEEALEAIDTAMRLNPHCPGWYLLMQGRAYVIAQRYEEALPPLQRSVSMVPGMTQVHATLAAAYAALGRLDDAKVHVERIKSLSPSFGRDYVRQVLPFMKRGDMDDFIALLEKAGLPE